eukprot:scaffold2991_cov250-Pinguiococcus_pyrenoidosus.AAC.1
MRPGSSVCTKKLHLDISLGFRLSLRLDAHISSDPTRPLPLPRGYEEEHCLSDRFTRKEKERKKKGGSMQSHEGSGKEAHENHLDHRSGEHQLPRRLLSLGLTSFRPPLLFSLSCLCNITPAQEQLERFRLLREPIVTRGLPRISAASLVSHRFAGVSSEFLELSQSHEDRGHSALSHELLGLVWRQSGGVRPVTDRPLHCFILHVVLEGLVLL